MKPHIIPKERKPGTEVITYRGYEILQKGGLYCWMGKIGTLPKIILTIDKIHDLEELKGAWGFLDIPYYEPSNS